MNEKFAYCIPFDNGIKGRIGGNPPKSIERLLPNDYIFYATLVHPEKKDTMLSILIHKDYDVLIENNRYPNIEVKVIEHEYSEMGMLKEKSCSELGINSIDDYTNAQKNLRFIKAGGTPHFIQHKDFYYKDLLKDDYSFFLQIDEEGYPDDLLIGMEPFGFGALYLYRHNKTNEIIAGYWQYS